MFSPQGPDDLSSQPDSIEFLEKHLANSPLAVIEWDHELRVRRWSGLAEAMLGWRQEEVIGRHPDDWAFIDPDDREQVSTIMASLAQGATARNISHNRNFHRDGHTLHCEWYNSVLRDEGGRIISILSLVQDVTARVSEQRHLQLLATIVENTSDGVMMTDADGSILAVNPAFTRVTGYAAHEIRGRNPRVLQSGRHDRQFYAQMWGALNQDGHWQGEIWNRRKSGEIYPQWINTNSIRNDQGQVLHYVSVFSDLTDVKRSEAELEQLAHEDPVTQLPNRLLFRSRLEQALRQRSGDQRGPAVLYIDVTDFKAVNDSFGHQVGDDTLRMVADRLSMLPSRSETLACLGGDEFTILCASRERATFLAEAILHEFASPLPIGDGALYLNLSLGIAAAPTAGRTVDELLQHAYRAANSAKAAGGNSYRFYAQNLTAQARRRLFLINGLRQALEHQQFELHYQPQLELKSGKVCGLEALLRWQHPEEGMISPGDFIPLAEEAGLIVQLGEWVLHQACADAARLRQSGHEFGHVAINVSALQLHQPQFPQMVQAALERHGLPADMLEIELTESAVMDKTTRPVLQQLRNFGISLALDDFGTGYSSLAYLQQLPFNLIKIDRAFLRNVPHADRDQSLLSAIVKLIHSLNRSVLVEGVETQAQRECLIALGVERAQGFLLARPKPVGAVAEFLAARERQ